MKSTILTIVLIFTGLTSFCQDWIYVGTDMGGDRWYIKSTYVKKDEFGYSGNDIRIWTKKELKKVTIKKAGKTLSYTNAIELRLIVVDCSEKRMKFIKKIVYNSQGKAIDSWTLQDYEQEWTDVIPDSIGEATLNKVCELFN